VQLDKITCILLNQVYKSENTTLGIRHADHVTPSFRKKLALTSLTSGGRSVGIVRLQTEATEYYTVKICHNKG
jgi:hypothetical protein